MIRYFFALVSVTVFAATVSAERPRSLLEAYSSLEFPPEPENFDKGWKDRVTLEFEIANTVELDSLRAGLSDENRFVRAMAARALGIREDKDSAEALAKLAREDPDFEVRTRAVESLGLLKMKLDVIEAAKKDPHGSVQWAADLAADQVKSGQECAAQIRQAFAVGIERKLMGTAIVGQPAPDFAAQTLDGEEFKLSSVLGKKPIAIYFAAFDQ